MYNPLFISGNYKDRIHLIHAIGNYVIEHFNYRVFYITAAEYSNKLKSMKDKEYKDKYENVDILIMDKIEYIINDLNAQSELFNELYSDNKQIFLEVVKRLTS